MFDLHLLLELADKFNIDYSYSWGRNKKPELCSWAAWNMFNKVHKKLMGFNFGYASIKGRKLSDNLFNVLQEILKDKIILMSGVYKQNKRGYQYYQLNAMFRRFYEYWNNGRLPFDKVVLYKYMPGRLQSVKLKERVIRTFPRTEEKRLWYNEYFTKRTIPHITYRDKVTKTCIKCDGRKYTCEDYFSDCEFKYEYERQPPKIVWETKKIKIPVYKTHVVPEKTKISYKVVERKTPQTQKITVNPEEVSGAFSQIFDNIAFKEVLKKNKPLKSINPLCTKKSYKVLYLNLYRQN